MATLEYYQQYLLVAWLLSEPSLQLLHVKFEKIHQKFFVGPEVTDPNQPFSSLLLPFSKRKHPTLL